jgi:hypothetical protein
MHLTDDRLNGAFLYAARRASTIYRICGNRKLPNVGRNSTRESHL